MNIEQFFDALTQEGFVKCEEITQLTDRKCASPNDVLVWENVNGNAIHGAYAVTERIIFNKMGQFWFQPWQCIRIELVFDYAGCISNGGRIGIYRKS